MMDLFVGELEKLLGFRKTEVNIADRWTECPPPEADGKSLNDYVDKVCIVILTCDTH
jgi:hypothetical protein